MEWRPLGHPGHPRPALEALRNYDVAPQRVRLTAESFNHIFRVTAASAEYALRVGSAWPIHPRQTAAVEAAWHHRLRHQEAGVPGVLANVDGVAATLVTGGQGRLRADRVLYWQAPERLAMAGARFGYGSLFADAAARAQPVLDWLWRNPPHPPHLVHGDLTPANVIVSPRSGLVPIDFQDMVLGFEVQDVSFTVAALWRWPNGDRLAGALWPPTPGEFAPGCGSAPTCSHRRRNDARKRRAE